MGRQEVVLSIWMVGFLTPLRYQRQFSCIKSTWAIPVGVRGGGVGVGGLRLLVGGGAGRGGAVGAGQGGRGEEEDGEDGLRGSKFVD